MRRSVVVNSFQLLLLLRLASFCSVQESSIRLILDLLPAHSSAASSDQPNQPILPSTLVMSLFRFYSVFTISIIHLANTDEAFCIKLLKLKNRIRSPSRSFTLCSRELLSPRKHSTKSLDLHSNLLTLVL